MHPDPAAAPTVAPAGESSVDVRADANVQWANPDALTRDQLIRVNALGAALNGAVFKTTADILTAARQFAAYITDGTVTEEARDGD